LHDILIGNKWIAKDHFFFIALFLQRNMAMYFSNRQPQRLAYFQRAVIA